MKRRVFAGCAEIFSEHFSFDIFPAVWQSYFKMSASVPPPISPLLTEVTQRLAKVEQVELDAVNRFLKKLEMLRLRRSIGSAADEACAAGLMNSVEESIREFRDRHPYA